MTVSTATAQYTEAQTAEVVKAYTEGQTIEAIATAIGKSARSVIAKLAREGVYKAKDKAKVGSERVTKAMLVAKIAAAVGASEEALESLEKASKEALELVAKAL